MLRPGVRRSFRKRLELGRIDVVASDASEVQRPSAATSGRQLSTFTRIALDLLHVVARTWTNPTSRLLARPEALKAARSAQRASAGGSASWIGRTPCARACSTRSTSSITPRAACAQLVDRLARQSRESPRSTRSVRTYSISRKPMRPLHQRDGEPDVVGEEGIVPSP